MKLSTRARYAVRLMLEVARRGAGDEPISMRTIAMTTGISKAYLDQITIPLRGVRLLRGRAGRAGGYTLGKPANEITVREVVEAAIGPVDLVECVGEPEFCPRAPGCETRIVWALMAHRIRSVLEEYTIADLIDPQFLDDTKQKLSEPFVPAEALRAHARTRGTPPWKQACGPLDDVPPASERQPARRRTAARGSRKTLVSG